MKKVTIIYRFLPQYRLEFYNSLREQLKNNNINLILLYGKSKNELKLKNDEIDIDWAICINQHFIKIGNIELIWQPVFNLIKDSDLIIVEQANKLLINYLLISLKKLYKYKLAYWGHGINRQISPKSIKNKFKRLLSNKCDWWFAYTNGVAKQLTKVGVSKNKITVVNNAIDTITLRNKYLKITDSEINILKGKLNIAYTKNVAVYVGGIYPEKRISFLLESCLQIKKSIDDFHIIIIGAGKQKFIVENYSKKYEWIHYMGPLFQDEKIPYLKLSRVMLMPGLVGLAILDCFATETPLITTDYGFHSPEIEYLINDYNGVITANTTDNYANNVIEILSNEARLNHLKQGCINSYPKYTTQKMVNNFKSGIVNSLSHSLS